MTGYQRVGGRPSAGPREAYDAQPGPAWLARDTTVLEEPTRGFANLPPWGYARNGHHDLRVSMPAEPLGGVFLDRLDGRSGYLSGWLETSPRGQVGGWLETTRTGRAGGWLGDASDVSTEALVDAQSRDAFTIPPFEYQSPADLASDRGQLDIFLALADDMATWDRPREACGTFSTCSYRWTGDVAARDRKQLDALRSVAGAYLNPGLRQNALDLVQAMQVAIDPLVPPENVPKDLRGFIGAHRAAAGKALNLSSVARAGTAANAAWAAQIHTEFVAQAKQDAGDFCADKTNLIPWPVGDPRRFWSECVHIPWYVKAIPFVVGGVVVWKAYRWVVR